MMAPLLSAADYSFVGYGSGAHERVRQTGISGHVGGRIVAAAVSPDRCGASGVRVRWSARLSAATPDRRLCLATKLSAVQEKHRLSRIGRRGEHEPDQRRIRQLRAGEHVRVSMVEAERTGSQAVMARNASDQQQS